MKIKIGRDQAWDYVKNDWRIKEMDVVYSLDTKEDISIAFELTNILQKTIENMRINSSFWFLYLII